MKKFFTLLMLVVISCSLLTSCKKNKGNPPTLPPEGSMAIDFSNFDAGKSGVKGINDENWAFAATVAGYFKSLIVTTLAVPVASFSYALDQTPTYLEEKTWQWSFDVSVLSVTYKGRLVGQIRSSDVLWKMYVSRTGTGAFPEFVWFEGTSKLDGTGGQWTLNHSSAFKEPVLQIDWIRSGTAITKVTYTYVRTLNDARATDPFKTSYIEYGKIATGSYNSYYKIHYYNGSAFSDVDVEWHSTNKIGHVKCQPYFLDTSWHCWDNTYTNTTCP
jgi:hypothetical protein